MIVQVTKPGNGFKGKVLYLMYGHLDNLNPDRVAWIETRNLPTDDPLAAARIMAATARDRRTRQKPVYHFSISFDYDDPADRALMLRVADRLLLDLKMQGYQALMVAHRDRAHAHLHVVINRIHPEDLTVWSNWKDYWRIERSLRAQEAELGLRVVPGFHAPVFDDNGNRLRPAQLVRDDADFMERVRVEAGPHLASARSWADLERELAAHGLRVRMKGRGMVVTDGKHEVKASDIDWAPGRARVPGDRGRFSRSRMEARLGIHGEYRLRQQLADRTLDERVALVEQAVVAAPSPESSTPAERTSEVTQAAASEPNHRPVSASLTQPTRQGEDDTRDPVVQTVATSRRDDVMPVSAETPRDSHGVAAADVPRVRHRLTPEPVSLPERHSDEEPDREEVAIDEPVPPPVESASLVRNESADAEAFLQMVERFRQSEAVQGEVRKLDEIRDNIEEWSRGFERVNADLRAAKNGFAREIRDAFRDPQAFNNAFQQLTEEQKRATLKTMRERPAEFAREFLAARDQKHAHHRERPHGWRARVANAVERVRGTTPETHVFRDPGDTASAGVLTAAAGERYLDAIRVRDSARRAVAQNLGLSETVTVKEVRDALSARMATATAQKAEAISRRVSLKAPTVQELERAFLRLSDMEQRWAMQRLSEVNSLVPKALRLGQDLAEGPRRSGPDWV